MTIKDIENLAELARIELTSEEKEGLLKDMEGILEYVKQIEGVQVEDVKEDHTVHNVWREDLPAAEGENRTSLFNPDLIIGQFPDKKDNFLKVKKIL